MSLKKLSVLIGELASNIPQYEVVGQTVSKASVGWHIEHALLTIDKIVDAVNKSNPDKYQWKFNLPRLLVFTIKKIPRGRAQSPDSVRPKNDYNGATLEAHVATTSEKINLLTNMLPNNYFEHPIFGKLHLKHTMKVLELHTWHHIQIIQDILKSNS